MQIFSQISPVDSILHLSFPSPSFAILSHPSLSLTSIKLLNFSAISLPLFRLEEDNVLSKSACCEGGKKINVRLVHARGFIAYYTGRLRPRGMPFYDLVMKKGMEKWRFWSI